MINFPDHVGIEYSNADLLIKDQERDLQLIEAEFIIELMITLMAFIPANIYWSITIVNLFL